MPFGMRNVKTNLLTIDSAGRIVVPQGIRKRFGLNPGSRLELDVLNPDSEVKACFLRLERPMPWIAE